MKRIKLFGVLFAATLVLASCNKNDETIVSNDDRVAVKFSSGINVQTRATETTWDDSDAIGVYMIANGSSLNDGNIINDAKNRKYTTTSANLGSFTADAANTIYLPSSGDPVSFIAYYPYATIDENFEYTVNTTDQSSFPAIDLMYSDNASSYNKSNPNVSLTFNHMLSKIEFNLIAGEGITLADIQNATVTLKEVYVEGKFSLVTKSVGSTGIPTDLVTVKPRSNVLHEAIIIPQMALSSTAEFNVGGNTYVWNMARNFAPGIKYQFNVTVTKVALDVTGTIEDWDTMAPEDVTAD